MKSSGFEIDAQFHIPTVSDSGSHNRLAPPLITSGGCESATATEANRAEKYARRIVGTLAGMTLNPLNRAPAKSVTKLQNGSELKAGSGKGRITLSSPLRSRI